jgi:hypothetical protein
MTKSKKHKGTQVYSVTEEDRAMRAISHMKHRDLQSACIARGMESQDMVNANHHSLVSWLVKNFDKTEDPQKLVEHDAWVESQLVKRGHTPGKAFLHPTLKFGISGDIEKVDRVKDIKPANAENIPEQGKKPKAEIDKTTGVRKGTKKDMTYSMTREGLPIAEIVHKVKAAFTDAQEKSIKIWHKRALKQIKDGNE